MQITSLPERLTRIDDTNRADHFYLDAQDKCFYFGEYFSGEGYSGGPTNQLIFNFKIKPSIAASNPPRRRYKEEAIRTIAAGLRKALAPGSIPQMTFVPIPPSKARGHVDYCDRGARTLKLAFGALDADVRELLVQTTSAAADHESDERITKSGLSTIVDIDPQVLVNPVRDFVVLFDDVLASGKHFKVCQERLREILPDRQIVGVFVARCVRPSRSEALEF